MTERRAIVCVPDPERVLADVGLDVDAMRGRMIRMGLSRRQRQVAWLRLVGCEGREIVQLTGMAPSTVKNHLTRAYQRAGVVIVGGTTTGPIQLLRVLCGAAPKHGGHG